LSTCFDLRHSLFRLKSRIEAFLSPRFFRLKQGSRKKAYKLYFQKRSISKPHNERLTLNYLLKRYYCHVTTNLKKRYKKLWAILSVFWVASSGKSSFYEKTRFSGPGGIGRVCDAESVLGGVFMNKFAIL